MTEPARTVGRSTAPHRLHPLSPLARLWAIVGALAFIVLRDTGTGDGGVGGREVLIVGGVLVAIGLVVLAGGYVAWWRTSFWFDEDGDFRLGSGLFEQRERRVQLSRLQAVDVVRPIAARVLGLAELRIDVAGGKDSNVRLAYLSQDEADRLRAELLARSAGIEHDHAEGPAPEAPESVLAVVPSDQLLRSVLLGGAGLGAIAGVVVVLIVFAVTREPGVLFTMFFAVAGLVAVAFKEFSTSFNFVLAESPDGLRTRHGLIETRAQTVPPGRVQAVGLSQPLLWRRPGWVRVHVVVAGYADASPGEATTVLLPVAPERVALELIARVLPGFDPRGVELQPVPPRARWKAPIEAPILAAGLGGTAVVSRTGRFTRRTSVVPYARLQSVRLEQGPVQRRLGLATVHVDVTAGPVSLRMPEREATQAREWTEEVTRRALDARAAGGGERWMRPRGT